MSELRFAEPVNAVSLASGGVYQSIGVEMSQAARFEPSSSLLARSYFEEVYSNATKTNRGFTPATATLGGQTDLSLDRFGGKIADEAGEMCSDPDFDFFHSKFTTLGLLHGAEPYRPRGLSDMQTRFLQQVEETSHRSRTHSVK